MTGDRRTALLAALVVITGVVSLGAAQRMGKLRADATVAERDLVETRAMLSDLSGAAAAAPVRASGIDPADLNQRLHDAAAAAGIPDPASIEPGTQTRVPDSDYEELPVFLRLDALTLKQLVTFLHHLADNDASCRTKTIELSTPENSLAAAETGSVAPAAATQNSNSPETWSADVTLAYRIYAPRVRQP